MESGDQTGFRVRLGCAYRSVWQRIPVSGAVDRQDLAEAAGSAHGGICSQATSDHWTVARRRTGTTGEGVWASRRRRIRRPLSSVFSDSPEDAGALS